jgi:radial spoke head protein 4/6
MLADTAHTLETLKRQLRTPGAQNTDLYSHLNEVFNRIIKFHPYDAFDRFEEISTLVKQTNFKIRDPKFDYEVNGQAHAPPSVSQMEVLAFIEKAKNLLKEKPEVSAGDRALLTKNQVFNMPNLSEQAMMLEWAGVDFGEDNTYIIQKSLKRLAVMSGATSLKFFGKIFGIQADYWVAQGTLDFQEEKPSNRAQEKRGEGANSQVYWVTNNLLCDWIQLPESQPEHLMIAREVKHVFTGNLNSKIDCCPPFPGKERHYLREQLGRITHATEICPKGLYEIDEET